MPTFDKMIKSLSYKQIGLARAIQKAGVATYTQAIKALYNHTADAMIAQLDAINKPPKPAAPAPADNLTLEQIDALPDDEPDDRADLDRGPS